MADLSEVQTFPPRVPSTHPTQRWYQAGGENMTVGNASVGFTLYRRAECDTAELAMFTTDTKAKASVVASLAAPELRALAQRLLDAAADLEAHPSHELVAAAEQVPA